MASDAALLARWTEQRDETAFTALVTRHGPMVLGVCRRVLGDVQHAEDAFQAVFLVLARKARSVRRPEALASFLYGVALRLSRKARGAARRHRIQSHPEIPEPVDPHPHALDVLSGCELLALLDAEVARLPEVYRLPLLLCVLQGRTVEEAARTLGWSIGSLRGRLARRRERLRERLTQRGLGLSVGTLVLLAPAVVPERLLADSVRNLAGPASAAVDALAGSATALKLKMVCLGVLVVTTVALGTGLALLRTPAPETPSAVPAVPPTQVKNKSRRDGYGDPLPPRAIARLGTLRFRVDGEIEGLTFAPDGKTIAVVSHRGMWLLDAVSGQLLRRIDPAGTMNPRLALAPDGRRLIGSCDVFEKHRFRRVVRVWDTASGRKVMESEPTDAQWLGWSAAGQPLAVCLGKGEMRLRDVASGRERAFPAKNLRDPRQSPVCVCAASKTLLAAADEKSVVHVWDMAGGEERCTLKTGGVFVRSVALSPDGRWLASLSREAANKDVVQLWDATTGKALHAIATNQRSLHSVAFSPDGNTLVSASADATVRLWQAPPLAEAPRQSAEAPTASPPAEVLHLFALEVHYQARATLTPSENTQRVDVTAIGDFPWNVQLAQVFDDLQEGATYTIRFRAKADAPRRIGLNGQIAMPDWHSHWPGSRCRFDRKVEELRVPVPGNGPGGLKQNHFPHRGADGNRVGSRLHRYKNLEVGRADWSQEKIATHLHIRKTRSTIAV